MDLAIVASRALVGIEAIAVTVEVHLARGLPSLTIVGLPETAVRESRERVRSAILNNHLEFPLGRITVNLAPADLPKEGGRFDLAIALGILVASGQVASSTLARHEFLGELALDGHLRTVRGVLSAAWAARSAGHVLIVPAANAVEAALVRNLDVRGARDLAEVIGHLAGTAELPRPAVPSGADAPRMAPDLADVRGQPGARRALEIAAAGLHNLLMVGPPGSGKTMLAERLPGILPPLAEDEAMECAAIASVGRDGFDPARWRERPFRAPHHTASAIALVGGGSRPRPGEISLAHHGVLFLDELPEFSRHVLEVLREPLESGRIIISRAANQARFPARFLLVGACNPCPCGYDGDPSGRCRCSPDAVARYRARLSGPLLDRIDLHVHVPNMTRELLAPATAATPESSAAVRARVMASQHLQLHRQGRLNARLGAGELEDVCALSTSQRRRLGEALDRLGLSGRALHRVLKVARTIADLAGEPAIADAHLMEALAYRHSGVAPGTLVVKAGRGPV